MSKEKPLPGTNIKEQGKKQQCIVCGKDAVYIYSPDLDIQGLGACEKHNTDVSTAYGILIFIGEDDFNMYLDACKKEFQLVRRP